MLFFVEVKNYLLIYQSNLIAILSFHPMLHIDGFGPVIVISISLLFEANKSTFCIHFHSVCLVVASTDLLYTITDILL